MLSGNKGESRPQGVSGMDHQHRATLAPRYRQIAQCKAFLKYLHYVLLSYIGLFVIYGMSGFPFRQFTWNQNSVLIQYAAQGILYVFASLVICVLRSGKSISVLMSFFLFSISIYDSTHEYILWHPKNVVDLQASGGVLIHLLGASLYLLVIIANGVILYLQQRRTLSKDL